MDKEKRIVVVIVLVFLVLGYAAHKYLHYRNLHPVKMYYFLPIHLTKDIPILKKIDHWFMASAGVDWYKVKHKKTGREYLLKIEYDYWATGNGRWAQHYWVMDNIKRDKWIEFTQEQFQKTFGNPDDGEALEILPNTNIKTYTK